MQLDLAACHMAVCGLLHIAQLTAACPSQVVAAAHDDPQVSRHQHVVTSTACPVLQHMMMLMSSVAVPHLMLCNFFYSILADNDPPVVQHKARRSRPQAWLS